MKNKLTILLGLLLLLSAFTTEKRVITIFTIGDSTMANKPLEGGNPERGWGQMLPRYFTEDVVIDNRAVNGRSTKSFIDEGRWDQVLAQLKKGNYVFIQFGHNDEKSDPKRHTEPGGTFDANLKRFVLEARAKGAIPVLFNSIVRRNFGEANAEAVALAVAQDDVRKGVWENRAARSGQEGVWLRDTHGAYLDSPRNVARELDVPFVDLNRATHRLVEEMGPEDSKQLFVWVAPRTVPALPDGRQDNTHLNVRGASIVARMAADEVVKVVPELAKYRRQYDFVVAKDGSGDFFTIQEAIDAVPDFRKNVRTTILVRKGVYKEKLVVPPSKINLSLVGEEGAVLTCDDYADKPNCFGEKTGTSGSATCYLYAPDCYVENLTFENSSGPWGRRWRASSVPTASTSSTAASWVSRIRSIPTARAAANIMRTATSKGRWTSSSDGLRRSSTVATSIARATATSPLLPPTRGNAMATSSTIAG